MFKQTIVTILILAFIASSTFASPVFTFSKLFETASKRSPADTNLCCLPNVFTMKGSFNQVAINSNNTLQTVEAGFTFVGDYKTGKLRQDIYYIVEGAISRTTTWDFKISSTITVSYDLNDGRCTCTKLNNFNQWNPFCISASGTVSKAKIGAYDALKVESSQYGVTGTFWTFREPQMANDKCWILSTYVVAPTAAQTQIYSDMVETVDGNVFNLPSQCPTMDKCLAQ